MTSNKNDQKVKASENKDLMTVQRIRRLCSYAGRIQRIEGNKYNQ